MPRVIITKHTLLLSFTVFAASIHWITAFLHANDGTIQRFAISRPLFMESQSSSLNTKSGSGSSSSVAEPPSPTNAASASPPASTAAATTTTKIDSLTSLEAFCDYIDNAPVDSLVAIKFYGNSCPLCKRIALKYKKMARYYTNAPIRFAEIEKSVHPQLFDTLQITTFPYLQLYRNGQCIASHGTESERMFERVVHDTIQHFLVMQHNNHWESFLNDFATPIAKATQNYQTMRDVAVREQQETRG